MWPPGGAAADQTAAVMALWRDQAISSDHAPRRAGGQRSPGGQQRLNIVARRARHGVPTQGRTLAPGTSLPGRPSCREGCCIAEGNCNSDKNRLFDDDPGKRHHRGGKRHWCILLIFTGSVLGFGMSPRKWRRGAWRKQSVRSSALDGPVLPPGVESCMLGPQSRWYESSMVRVVSLIVVLVAVSALAGCSSWPFNGEPLPVL